MKKKILISALLISGVAMLASCTESSTDSELRIVDQCNTASGLCKFELTDAVINRQSYILGKATTHVVSQTPIQSIEGDITWVAPGGTLADNATVETAFGTGCENDVCTDSANPTAFTFGAGGHSISVTGTIMHNGQSINLADAVAPVSIDTELVADSHTFLRSANPPLPIGQSMSNVVAVLNQNAAAANGSFSVDGDSWKITCNQGYEYLAGNNTSWGTQGQDPNNRQRGVSYIVWTPAQNAFVNIPLSLSGATYNGSRNDPKPATYFLSGCWPIV